MVLELRRRANEDAKFKNARIAIVTDGTFIDQLLKAFLRCEMRAPLRKFSISTAW